MTSTRRSVTPIEHLVLAVGVRRPAAGHGGEQLFGGIEEVEQVLLFLFEVGHPPVVRPSISFFGESGTRAHVCSLSATRSNAEDPSLMFAGDRTVSHP